MVEKLKHNIYHILMNKSSLYFDKKYKCVPFIVHYKGISTLTQISLNGRMLWLSIKHNSYQSVWTNVMVEHKA